MQKTRQKRKGNNCLQIDNFANSQNLKLYTKTILATEMNFNLTIHFQTVRLSNCKIC